MCKVLGECIEVQILTIMNVTFLRKSSSMFMVMSGQG